MKEKMVLNWSITMIADCIIPSSLIAGQVHVRLYGVWLRVRFPAEAYLELKGVISHVCVSLDVDGYHTVTVLNGQTK